ncbi:MAG: hypothetical protein MMC33_010584 [Icmadophila ericetorum]|nr:hypothetical protein [Icmadophila ericetorum]
MASQIFSYRHERLEYAIACVAISILTTFLVKLFRVRRRIWRLAKQGLPMPPYHPIFGHLLEARNIYSTMPPDAHPLYLPDQLRRKYPSIGPVFYVDMWPFTQPFLFANSTTTAYQLMQEHPQVKADVTKNFMYPLTSNNDLVSLEGQLWKEWRNALSPAFSANNLIVLLPQILEAVSTFMGVLEKHAQANDTFYLEDAAINMTMDVIGTVTLGARFDSQKSNHEFASALREQMLWLTIKLNPLDGYNPIRPLAIAYYNSIMDKFLSQEIDKRFGLHQRLDDFDGPSDSKKSTVLGLAFERYTNTQQLRHPGNILTSEFKHFVMGQLKGLILAGHGTTANTMCFVYYLLSKHPAALQRVREEHDRVLGKDTSQTVSIILQRPHILNQLPYTLGIIKEALRLYPADSSPRRGSKNFSLKEEGRLFPTEGCQVWTIPQAIHRVPLYWPDTDAFIPERWLATADDPLHPVKGAFRPFEFGPRNCIGQELAMLELRLTLVLAIRKFDFDPRFEEWEQKNGVKSPRMVNGELGYQILEGTNRPRNGFPCRVSLRG